MDIMNSKDTGKITMDNKLIENIINGMYDWVRVLDKDDNIIYINQSMSQALNNLSIGEKCYKAVGRNSPCENCISRRAVFDGKPQHKEEIINGRIYSVMSSPVKNETGEIVSVVEVLRDITEMKQMQQKIVEQNRKLQFNLNIARKLQCSLLPKGLPEDKINFSFIYKPCEAIGGDFLDIFRIDAEHIGIYIADVSGHGVPASMLTVFLRSTLDKKVLSPSKALERLYREFNSSSFDDHLYITVFYAVINLNDRTMVYSNAGHNVCPIILKQGEFDILRSAGIPISNWLPAPGYSDKSLQLSSGNRIFLYTDGIVELKNQSGTQFGEKRILDVLLSECSSPAATLNTIVDNACEFAGIDSSGDIPDDITMALLEIM